ncbi:hypothetical protein EVAR_82163_1 [Eumeta japonica]|uniref:Uncharacterized protein n=1 Tax=Eumeta variegata TaxID=151549 RepID=A0A4C1U212_EUMVA|nr:hypothetical protein EVAR_82163_1 [Eumeta japonica]
MENFTPQQFKRSSSKKVQFAHGVLLETPPLCDLTVPTSIFKDTPHTLRRDHISLHILPQLNFHFPRRIERAAAAQGTFTRKIKRTLQRECASEHLACHRQWRRRRPPRAELARLVTEKP